MNGPLLLVDPEAQRERLRGLLDRLVALFERSAVRDALGDTALLEVRRDRDAVLRRAAEPFTVLVLGDFKRGKSTLVNALVGAEVATVDVTPETVTVNAYVRGPAARALAVLPDGTRAVLTPEDLRHDTLVEHLARLPARPSHVVVERPEAWLEGLRLVDTPGLGDLDPQLARAVQDWLPAADAVLFVISALSPLSESERLFLKLSLAPAELTKITFVVNRIDALPDPRDVERVTSAIAGKLGTTFPDARVFPVSALRPDDARFAALRRHLTDGVLVDRDLVKLDRAAVGAVAAHQRARNRIDRLDKALALDLGRLSQDLDQLTDQGGELLRSIAARRAALITGVEGLGEVAAGWMEAFVDRLAAQVAVDLSRHPHETLRRHFPFFLAERTREALTACLEAHRGDIDDRLRAATRARGGDAGLGLTAEPSGMASVSTPQTAWTLADDLGMLTSAAALVAPYVGPLIATVLVPLGLLDSVAGMAVRGVLNRTGGEQTKGQAFHEHVLHTLPELKRSLGKQVRDLYHELAERVAARFDEVWRAELEASRGALAQAKVVTDRGTANAAAAREALSQAEAALAELGAELDALRADLQRLA